MRENIRKAVKELDGGTGYSLVLNFGRVNVMDTVRMVRRVSNVPILVIRKRPCADPQVHGVESPLWLCWM